MDPFLYLSCFLIIQIFQEGSSHYFEEDDGALNTRDVATANQKPLTKYKKKVRGFFVPPQTGEYKFYSSCEEPCDVYLSGNDKSSSKSKIISQEKKTDINVFEKFPSQASHLIYLNYGKRYYIEADTKSPNAVKNTHISVGVILPDDTKLFPIKKPFIKDVVVENIMEKEKKKKVEIVTHEKAKKINKKKTTNVAMKDVGKSSSSRLQKKLKQIGIFIKDLERTKAEEAKFDLGFDDVMKNLQESLEKYGPTDKKSFKNKGTSNTSQKSKTSLKSHSKVLEQLRSESTKTSTGKSRTFRDSPIISSKEKTSELLDALQKSLDIDSKKYKKFNYYHEKFENLTDQMNSLKNKVQQDIAEESPEKRHKDGEKHSERKKHEEHDKEGDSDGSGSGDGEDFENNFRKHVANRNEEDSHNDFDSSTKTFDNDVFSTIPSIKKMVNFKKEKSYAKKLHHSIDGDLLEDDFKENESPILKFHHRKFQGNEHKHLDDEARTSHHTEKEIGNFEKENERTESEANKHRVSGEPQNQDESHTAFIRGHSHYNLDGKVTSKKVKNDREEGLKTTAESRRVHNHNHNKGITDENLTISENSKLKETSQHDNAEHSFDNTSLQNGVQADESVYRLPSDYNSNVITTSYKQGSTKGSMTHDIDEIVTSKLKEATGSVRSQSNVEDLKSPIVVHASLSQEEISPIQSESQMKIVNKGNDKEEIKTLEDTLFNAFQERVVGETKHSSHSPQDVQQQENHQLRPHSPQDVQQQEQQQLQEKFLAPLTLQSSASSFEQGKLTETPNAFDERVVTVEKKPPTSATLVNIDTSNLRNVLNNAFNNRPIGKDGTVVDSNNLREKLQESIESALRNSQNTDKSPSETSSIKQSANFLPDQGHLVYKTSENAPESIVSMYSNTFKNTQENKIDEQPFLQENKIVDDHFNNNDPMRYGASITESAEQRTPQFLQHERIPENSKYKDINADSTLKFSSDNRDPSYVNEDTTIHREFTKPLVQNEIPTEQSEYTLEAEKKEEPISPLSENPGKEIFLSQTTDKQVFEKISDLIREINNIKLEIVAMKRNKVSGTSHKKSLIEKLQRKTRLLSRLKAKKNMISKPAKQFFMMKPVSSRRG